MALLSLEGVGRRFGGLQAVRDVTVGVEAEPGDLMRLEP